MLGLDVALADGRRHHAPAARPGRRSGPDLNQLFVGSRGHARDHHRRPAAAAPRARRTSGAAPTASRSFDDGLDAHAPHRPAGRHARRAAPLRRRPRPTAPTTPATGPCCSCSTRATARWSTPRWSSSPRCAATAQPRATTAHVGHWLEHRNDVAALEALISRGYVVDTMEVVGPLARPARRSTRATLDALARRRGHARRRRPPVAQLPRRRLPLLHLRRPGRRRRPRPPTTARLWDAGTRAVLAAGGALSATTTASA